MKGNIVIAAAVLGVGMIISAVIVLLALHRALDDTLTRMEAGFARHAAAVEQAGASAGAQIHEALQAVTVAVQAHGDSTEQGATRAGAQIHEALQAMTVAVAAHADSIERGGARAGEPIQQALTELAEVVAGHAQAVEQAGLDISRPRIRIDDPLRVEQPVMIEGTIGEHRALPVNVTIDAP
jgi:hypothetical protein